MSSHASRVWINRVVIRERSLSRLTFLRRQQIRRALARAFEGLLAAPAFDVGVVAAEQDVGDFPA